MDQNQQQYNFKLFEPIIIIAFWALLFASPLLFGRYEEEIDWPRVFTVWLNYLPLLVLFLLNRFLLVPQLFFKGKKKLYFIVSLGLIFIFTATIYFVDEQIIQENRPLLPPVERTDERPPRRMDMDQPNPPPNRAERRNLPPGANNRLLKNPRPIPHSVNFLILAFLLVGFDTGLQIALRWAKLEKEKVDLEKESVENQLAILKNQVSPHFFMNTLNNIHALVDIDSEKAKDAIIKLSSLMRHLLYDSEGNTTPIKKEVAFIKSYIELMKLRFSDKVTVSVDIPEDIPEKSIPPLLFTSLLENAFKHGISYKEASFISIALSFSENELHFEIENSKHQKSTDEMSGIGLKNTKKRLDLLYQNSYSFKISETDTTFKIHLNLPL